MSSGPRTILYTVLWAGVGIALVVALFLRIDIDMNVTPVRNPTFVTLSDGSIRNTYDLRLRNKQGEDRAVPHHADLGRAAEHRGRRATRILRRHGARERDDDAARLS